MRATLTCAAIAAAALLAPDALAAGDDPAELPLETLALLDTASVQEQLELQVSLFPTWLEFRAPEQHWIGAGLELELGLLDGLELELGTAPAHSWMDGASASGLGNTEVGLAVSLHRSERIALAAGVEGELPATHELLGETAPGASATLLGDLGLKRLHGTVLVGGEAGIDGSEVEPVALAGLGVYVDLGRLVPTLEALAEVGAEAALQIAPGLFANVSRHWEVGAAAALGVAGDAPAYGVIGVVTFEADLGGEEEEQ